MRRSTTFAGTDRSLLGLLLVAELIVATVLVALAGTPSAPPNSGSSVSSTPVGVAAGPDTRRLRDGRSVQLVDLGGEHTAGLLARVGAELDQAAAAVSAFWGEHWHRDIIIAAAATDEQFRVLAGGGPDIAAATVGARLVLAPGAAQMSDSALRIVLRHELFHYAAGPDTAADAPRWLTEGVADFVARPATGPPADPGLLRLPTDVDLDTPGPVRSLAYDRAWWFSSFVADRYGAAALRDLYLRACGAGHPDVPAAVREVLGADLDEVLAEWRRWPSG